MMSGDTIVALAGERVRHLDDLQAILSGDLVGQAVKVRIVRGGRVEEREVTIGERIEQPHEHRRGGKGLGRDHSGADAGEHPVSAERRAG